MTLSEPDFPDGEVMLTLNVVFPDSASFLNLDTRLIPYTHVLSLMSMSKETRASPSVFRVVK